MKNMMWFKLDYPNGTHCWVYSNRGWAGLIDYVAKMPSNTVLYNGTTVSTATRFESFLCFIHWLFGSEIHKGV